MLGHFRRRRARGNDGTNDPGRRSRATRDESRDDEGLATSKNRDPRRARESLALRFLSPLSNFETPLARGRRRDSARCALICAMLKRVGVWSECDARAQRRLARAGGELAARDALGASRRRPGDVVVRDVVGAASGAYVCVRCVRVPTLCVEYGPARRIRHYRTLCGRAHLPAALALCMANSEALTGRL